MVGIGVEQVRDAQSPPLWFRGDRRYFINLLDGVVVRLRNAPAVSQDGPVTG